MSLTASVSPSVWLGLLGLHAQHFRLLAWTKPDGL